MPEFGGQFFWHIGVDVAEDGIAVLLVADDDVPLPAAVLLLAYHAVSGWPAHRHFFFTSEVLSLIGIAGLARATGRWAQFYQIAVVPVQRLQDQSRPRTEAQDEILQSQSTADLVPCVDEPQQQTVASPFSSLVSCSSHSRDCSITFIREALERTWQSYGMMLP